LGVEFALVVGQAAKEVVDDMGHELLARLVLEFLEFVFEQVVVVL
jgi:hypothetical protein